MDFHPTFFNFPIAIHFGVYYNIISCKYQCMETLQTFKNESEEKPVALLHIVVQWRLMELANKMWVVEWKRERDRELLKETL